MKERVVPMMPEEFKGKIMGKTSSSKNNLRKWTKEEEEWCLILRSQGYNRKAIALSTGRDETSVALKLKRLTKTKDTYNKNHIIDKYNTNREYFEVVKPKSILDVYCGVKSYWRNNYNLKTVTNDKDSEIDADYHLDALRFLCLQYYEGNKYDVVDLDPFGSTYECLDLAIKIAKKGLIVTIGEMGHKRFKRLDYVRRMYGINSLEEFTSDRIIEEIQKIGLRNKKILKVQMKRDWAGISRVWFTIDNLIITEQWDKEK